MIGQTSCLARLNGLKILVKNWLEPSLAEGTNLIILGIVQWFQNPIFIPPTIPPPSNS